MIRTIRTNRTQPGGARRSTPATWATQRSAWSDAGGLVPIVAALALWAWLAAGVLAPLGAALAHLDAADAPAAPPTDCPVPPDAIAAAPGAGTASCR